VSTFEWSFNAPTGFPGVANQPPRYGRVVQKHFESGGAWCDTLYLLLRCAGCGRGGLAVVNMQRMQAAESYPHFIGNLVSFHPEARERFKLPDAVPEGIRKEFREAEQCMEAECYRAAAGLFRSVLDKTMRANGYKTRGVDLYNQIEAAAGDGVITEARKRRAHDDIRVLGNDVLHDDWEPIPPEAVEAAHHYAQRILEDFYDDRPTTLALLRAKGRAPDEDKRATP
jgi:hypothetical protein